MIIRSQGVQVLGGQYVNMVLQSIEILRCARKWSNNVN
jgi:hypothetical protein